MTPQPRKGTHEERRDDAVARIAATLAGSGATLAVAESLTCGAVVNALGRGESASTWLAGGVVAYRTDVKVALLGLADGVDPCSAECAEQLARGVLALCDADVAVATTGVGGPEPEGEHAPGTVYLGWVDGDVVGHELIELEGGPEEVVQQTVLASLDRLLQITQGRRQAISSSS